MTSILKKVKLQEKLINTIFSPSGFTIEALLDMHSLYQTLLPFIHIHNIAFVVSQVLFIKIQLPTFASIH